jgi:hypothetical protein
MHLKSLIATVPPEPTNRFGYGLDEIIPDSQDDFSSELVPNDNQIALNGIIDLD